MDLKNEAVLIGCGVLAAYVIGSYLVNNLGKIAQAAPQAIADAAAGAVIGTGKIIGIPETNETECEAALREGRTWDASFACPAGTFIKSIF